MLSRQCGAEQRDGGDADLGQAHDAARGLDKDESVFDVPAHPMEVEQECALG